MLGRLLKKIFGTSNDRIVKKLLLEIEQINKLEPEIQTLSDEALKAKTDEFKSRLAAGATLDEITYEAFATVREAGRRLFNMRHFDVQLVGGLILHRGMIAEMRTGEGKTLVATLPAYLNALSGNGVHIVTVNDYLCKRDAEWMGQIYRFLGLSVGCVTSGMSDQERQASYQCDITHIPNNELGFDFLRDNMKYSMNSKVQRPLNFAIIDEVDSILIDEARTPLVISGPVDQNSELYAKINSLIPSLSKDDYEKDEKMRSVNLTEDGINKIEHILQNNGFIPEGSNLYDFDNLILVHHINQALKAHCLFTRDVDYLVREGKVMIIDEFTGRVMDGRRYSDGLHQALEAKEGVQIQNENQTLASITFQNYFRMYPKIAGMTGTAMTESSELKDIYNLDVVAVPTHNKIQRKDYDDEIYGTKIDKYNAIIKLIEDCYTRGQPVLVGTVSVEKSEEISNLLVDNNIKHSVLNAKFHEQEAQIIAQAGRFGSVTIATNMAGRGTDIMLGGNSEMLAHQNPNLDLSFIKTQVEEEKQKVIAVGGLYVIGTERHESRRIDNQLRGRSGRLGDPGSTKFFLSLEDDLMRIFASDRVAGILRSLGLKDGEAIHHPMISRSLEKAQQKVEAHNYEIRKNLLRFDNVMNDQRKVIYNQRNDIIKSQDISEMFLTIAEELSENTTKIFIPPESYRENWNLDGLTTEVHRLFGIKLDQNAIASSDVTEVEISKNIYEQIAAIYRNKCNQYGNMMLEAGKYVFLTTLDQVWKDHLHHLDHLRQGISLRAYAQKDPLSEYKKEAFTMFSLMLDSLQELFVQRVCYLHIDRDDAAIDASSLENKQLAQMYQSREDPAFSKYNSGLSLETQLKQLKYVKPEDRIPTDPETWGKISRNESCPCNSGKKYKYCHGANA